MKIVWTAESLKRLKEIFDYYNKEASIIIAKKLVEGIISHTDILVNQPEIRSIEELLKKRKNNYRYLVYKNYKIIYWHDNDKIYIATVFDTRQNPQKMKKDI